MNSDPEMLAEKGTTIDVRDIEIRARLSGRDIAWNLYSGRCSWESTKLPLTARHVDTRGYTTTHSSSETQGELISISLGVVGESIAKVLVDP